MCHALSTCENLSEEWVIDSGATSHMCHDKSLFVDFAPLRKQEVVSLGDGHQQEATGHGTVMLELDKAARIKKCKLQNVLYVPTLTYSLISVGKATNAKKKIVFKAEGCNFLDTSGKFVATGRKVGGLYLLNTSSILHGAATTKQASNTSQLELWHRRFGHLGINNIKRLIKEDMVVGMNCDTAGDVGVCEPCAEGKQRRTKFLTRGGKRSDAILGLVHSNVCGKMSTPSLGGGEYFLTFIDDKTRYTWVYVLKRKDQVFEKFLEWKASVEKSTGEKLKPLGLTMEVNTLRKHLRTT